ncbi:MAG: hypothetical protein AAF458_12815 [Pseudomonadota bacterium]
MTSLPVEDYRPSHFEFAEVLAAWGIAALAVPLVLLTMARML